MKARHLCDHLEAVRLERGIVHLTFVESEPTDPSNEQPGARRTLCAHEIALALPTFVATYEKLSTLMQEMIERNVVVPRTPDNPDGVDLVTHGES